MKKFLFVTSILFATLPLTFTTQAQTGPTGTVSVAEPPGKEFEAAVNLLKDNAKVEGKLFVPTQVSRIRAVIVVIRWGNGSSVYDDPEWRTLSEAIESGLLRVDFSTIATPTSYVPGLFQPVAVNALETLLRRLADESGHQELISAPLIYWGHSQGGVLVSRFVLDLNERTVAFVGYHSGSASGPGFFNSDQKAFAQVPALHVAGGKDTSVPAERVKSIWERGRSIGGPWTFAFDQDATHGSGEALKNANKIMIPWLTSVVRHRLSLGGTSLRPVTDGSGWMGNNETGEVAPYVTFTGSKPGASWLPDENTARAWQRLLVR